jgi:peptide/nickel transport system permease protein
LIPVGTGMGYQIAGLLSGSVFIEKVFSYPGLGRLFIDSIQTRDYTVVNALVLLFSALTALGTLLSDIIISYLDPRIRID